MRIAWPMFGPAGQAEAQDRPELADTRLLDLELDCPGQVPRSNEGINVLALHTVSYTHLTLPTICSV